MCPAPGETKERQRVTGLRGVAAEAPAVCPPSSPDVLWLSGCYVGPLQLGLTCTLPGAWALLLATDVETLAVYPREQVPCRFMTQALSAVLLHKDHGCPPHRSREKSPLNTGRLLQLP